MRVSPAYLILAMISIMYVLIFADLYTIAFVVAGCTIGLSMYLIDEHVRLSKCTSIPPSIKATSTRLRKGDEAEIMVDHPCDETIMTVKLDPHLAVAAAASKGGETTITARAKWIGEVNAVVSVDVNASDKFGLVRSSMTHKPILYLTIEPPTFPIKKDKKVEAMETLQPYDYSEPAARIHWPSSARLNELIAKSPRRMDVGTHGANVVLEWSKCMAEGEETRRIDKALTLISSMEVSSLWLAGESGCTKIKWSLYDVEKMYINAPPISKFTGVAGLRRTIVITSMKCVDFASFILMAMRLPADGRIILATPEPRVEVNYRGPDLDDLYIEMI